MRGVGSLGSQRDLSYSLGFQLADTTHRTPRNARAYEFGHGALAVAHPYVKSAFEPSFARTAAHYHELGGNTFKRCHDVKDHSIEAD